MSKCKICGATISETNYTGIGGGCHLNIVLPALKEWRYHAFGLEFWGKKIEYMMTFFTEAFGQRKFRNQFKKEFTASVIKQWEERQVMSKKQFEICINMLEENHIFIKKGLEDIKHDWFYKLHPDNTGGKDEQFYEERISFYKKMYLSGRKNTKIED